MLRKILLFMVLPFALHADPYTISVVGQPETVFHYATDHCKVNYNAWQQGELDFPDGPARAFMTSDGHVQLIATNSHGLYRSIGGITLDSAFKRDCSPLLMGNYAAIGANSSPSQYDDQLWIWSVWADEKTRGQNIYLLVHNEFHGELNPTYCSTKDKNQCWYSNIIAAFSNNVGQSYSIIKDKNKQALPALASPIKYVNDTGRHGIPNTSNIVKNFFDPHDSHYYILALSMVCGKNNKTNQPFCKNMNVDQTKMMPGMCVYHTDKINYDNKPTLWLGYDAKINKFDVNNSQNPYTQKIGDLNASICTPVLPSLFRFGLSYNTVLKQYIAIGLDTQYPAKNGTISTIVYAVSQGSLLKWDTGTNGHGYCIKDSSGECIQMTWMKPTTNPNIYSVGYPTLIDSNSPALSEGYGYTSKNPDINFQFTGSSPDFYYVTYPAKNSIDGPRARNMMKIQLVVKSGN